MTKPIWTPSSERIETSNLGRFIQFTERRHGMHIRDYDHLYHWSVEDLDAFWKTISEFCDIHFSDFTKTIISDAEYIEKATFFEGAKLNYAENLLRRRDKEDGIIFWGEDKVKRRLSFEEIYDKTSQLTQYFRELGVKAGDRVAGFVPNAPETILCMLAATSLGAVWTSCSPDFGVNAVIDRFGQVEPTVLISADKYFYRGKEFSCLEKLQEIQKLLPSVEKTILFSYEGGELGSSELPNTETYDAILGRYKPEIMTYVPVKFNDPLFIMYSSGTTGVPKCIVHGVGGTLIQHLKEHQLHCDIKPNDRVFYFSTCGWMMWNWQVTALASRAALVIYDGSPVHPSENILFDLIEQEKITFFGTAAKIIDEWKKRSLCPKNSHKLTTLRDIASTGSPLVPESFDYLYDCVKKNMGVMSISGGTDIISCFVLGNPIAPIWRGEIQTPGLGMAVQIFSDKGEPIDQEKGELVCTKPFPSMPIYFWNDPKGEKYYSAYFEKFSNTWCHGDFAERTANKGFVIYGRSDTILNPGGVRIGTAEIYRQVEKIPSVLESIVVGQSMSDDVRVILFVKLQEGANLTENLKKEICRNIRANTSPRHVPACIIQVPDIPRTKSGKLVELAVKNVIEGRPIKNKDALANPESLANFENLEELCVS